VYRGRTPVPAAEIVVADLSGWATDAGYGQVVVDPQTGRIDFPPTEETEEGVWVRYHHLGVGAIGAGGGRDDELTAEEAASQASGCLRVIKVAVGHADESVLGSVTTAIDTWLADARTDGRVHGVIEILDSNLYEEDFDIRIGAGMQLDIRAVPGQHPVLRSVDEQHNRPKRVRVEGHPVKGEVDPPRLSLSGLTIAEHALELKGEFGRVFIDHCAIVPEHDDPDRRHLAIAITAMPCPVTITSSIIGEVRINTAEVGHDPVELSISDSILDAGPDGGRAISGADDRPGYAALSLNRATVLGEINVFQADAQDSIITGHFFSRRRQSGAIRFCYLPPMSHVPQRVSCQPDGVLARIDDDLRAGLIDAAKHQGLLISEPARVRPRFDSTGFATSGFCRLALDNAAEITHGSQDDGELGALHDLWLTRRVDDMTTRLTEFTPIGVELDIVFAT
jgi:hypothetical protein